MTLKYPPSLCPHSCSLGSPPDKPLLPSLRFRLCFQENLNDRKGWSLLLRIWLVVFLSAPCSGWQPLVDQKDQSLLVGESQKEPVRGVHDLAMELRGKATLSSQNPFFYTSNSRSVVPGRRPQQERPQSLVRSAEPQALPPELLDQELWQWASKLCFNKPSR